LIKGGGAGWRTTDLVYIRQLPNTRISPDQAKLA
jgi:hypothetical protein